jgi:two-component system chemotaxis response regulator CheY
MKFLIVDDSATMRRIVINTLHRMGHHDVVEAADGAEALAKFCPEVVLVITEWELPAMTGIEFARALRARPDGAAVPILMMTTRGLREDVLEAVQAGVDSYVVKPCTPLGLREKIEHLLDQRAARGGTMPA